MQCFLLTETGVPTSGRLTPALQGSLDIYDSTPAQGQGCTTCPCAALVSPGETVSIKVHTVYSDGLNRMKFVYRSWTLQGRPQNCIMVRAKRRLVRQDAVPFIFSYHRNTLISAATFIRSSKCPLKKPTWLSNEFEFLEPLSLCIWISIVLYNLAILSQSSQNALNIKWNLVLIMGDCFEHNSPKPNLKVIHVHSAKWNSNHKGIF